MAENDFIGGLFGGVRDAGSALFGLLGGPSGTPAAGGPTDPYDMLSEGEKRRLTYGALGQLGATLLAAGQKQMPAQRAQQLAQLGNIGPNLDMQMQRAVAVRNQQEQLRRQNELFPLQRQQLEGTLAQQQLQQQVLQRQLEQARQQAEYRRQLMEQMGGAGPAPAGAPGAGAPQTTTVPSSAAADQNIPAQPMPTAPAAAPAPAAAQPSAASVLSALPQDYLRNRLSDPNVTIADIYKEALAAQQGAEKTQFERADKLRDEFSKTAVPFNDRQTAFMTMRDLAANKAGASDMALVLSIMKVYDPTSTVTGGEAATAQNAAGVPSLVASYYNRLVGGGSLDDTARAQLVRAAETRFEQEMDKFEKDLGRYSTLATRAKIDPKDVVEDFRNPELAAIRTRKRDLETASKTIGASDILGLDLETLQLLNPNIMSKAAKDAYAARVKQLQPGLMPPAAPTGQTPAAGYGLGQNPLGSAMRRYPRGLMREDELPVPGF